MERFKVPDDQPMESGLLSKQVENAQKKVEEQNFVARKNVLKYDDVMTTQREKIYAQRRQVLEGMDLSEEIKGWIDEVIERLVALHTEGQDLVEYALLITFIALACIVGMQNLGTAINNKYNAISTSLSGS